MRAPRRWPAGARIVAIGAGLALMVAGAVTPSVAAGLDDSAPGVADDRAGRAPSPVPAILPLILQTRTPRDADASDRREGADGEAVLTIDEAVALALRQNRQVKNATLAVGMAENQMGAARAQMLPHLYAKVTPSYRLTPIDLTFDRGSFGTFASTGPIPPDNTTIRTDPGFSTSVEAGVTQPLSQLYALRLSVDQHGIARDILRHDLRAQRQGLASTVRQQYHAVLQSQSSLEALAEQLAANQELLRFLSEQAERQAVLPSVVLQAKAALMQAEYNVGTTRHALESQKEQLNVLLGRDPETPFRVTETPAAVPLPVDVALAREAALRQRADLQKAKLQTAHSDYGVRLSRAAYIPDVSLIFRYISPITSENLPRNIAYTGVELSWDIFDWGRKQHHLERSKKALEQAKNAAAEAAAQVVLEVNAASRRLEDAGRFLQVAESNRDYARESLREIMARFRQEAALPKDVLAAQATLGQASDQYRQAVLTYWEAQSAFDKAVGTDQ